MNRAVPSIGLRRSAAFARAAARYWLRAFPVVVSEVRRRRELALAVPDPVLRRIALQALGCKRCNLEGAAAFELLRRRSPRGPLIRALSACQMMCDYLDLLVEQPSSDPVANGRRLHEALIVALTPGEPHCDYYACHSRRDDGGYLRTLVEDIQGAVAGLPAIAVVQAPLRRAAQRIAAYQSFNHGDAEGSYAGFEEWASAQRACARRRSPGASGLSRWEAGAGAGSTLTAYALIASATDSRLSVEDARAIEGVYFPWIGALHSLLDSLVDQHEDALTGERGLIGCYSCPERAALRMDAIARQASQRAQRLPAGPRHGLLLLAMTAFYLSDARAMSTDYARAVVPPLLTSLGSRGKLSVFIIDARRRAAGRPVSERALLATAK